MSGDGWTDEPHEPQKPFEPRDAYRTADGGWAAIDAEGRWQRVADTEGQRLAAAAVERRAAAGAAREAKKAKKAAMAEARA